MNHQIRTFLSVTECRTVSKEPNSVLKKTRRFKLLYRAQLLILNIYFEVDVFLLGCNTVWNFRQIPTCWRNTQSAYKFTYFD
jgi:hypothetical protein